MTICNKFLGEPDADKDSHPREEGREDSYFKVKEGRCHPRSDGTHRRIGFFTKQVSSQCNTLN